MEQIADKCCQVRDDQYDQSTFKGDVLAVFGTQDRGTVHGKRLSTKLVETMGGTNDQRRTSRVAFESGNQWCRLLLDINAVSTCELSRRYDITITDELITFPARHELWRFFQIA